MDAREYDHDGVLVRHDVDQGDGTARRFLAVDGAVDYDGPFEVVDAVPTPTPDPLELLRALSPDQLAALIALVTDPQEIP